MISCCLPPSRSFVFFRFTAPPLAAPASRTVFAPSFFRTLFGFAFYGGTFWRALRRTRETWITRTPWGATTMKSKVVSCTGNKMLFAKLGPALTPPVLVEFGSAVVDIGPALLGIGPAH